MKSEDHMNKNLTIQFGYSKFNIAPITTYRFAYFTAKFRFKDRNVQMPCHIFVECFERDERHDLFFDLATFDYREGATGVAGSGLCSSATSRRNEKREKKGKKRGVARVLWKIGLADSDLATIIIGIGVELPKCGATKD